MINMFYCKIKFFFSEQLYYFVFPLFFLSFLFSPLDVALKQK